MNRCIYIHVYVWWCLHCFLFLQFVYLLVVVAFSSGTHKYWLNLCVSLDDGGVGSVCFQGVSFHLRVYHNLRVAPISVLRVFSSLRYIPIKSSAVCVQLVFLCPVTVAIIRFQLNRTLLAPSFSFQSRSLFADVYLRDCFYFWCRRQMFVFVFFSFVLVCSFSVYSCFFVSFGLFFFSYTLRNDFVFGILKGVGALLWQTQSL